MMDFVMNGWMDGRDGVRDQIWNFEGV